MRSFVIRLLVYIAAFFFGVLMAPGRAKCDPLEPAKPNRFSLLGGYGPDGLTIGLTPGQTSVTPYYGLMLGAAYQRLVWEDLSVGAFALGGSSPQSRTFVGAMSLGWDW